MRDGVRVLVGVKVRVGVRVSVRVGVQETVYEGVAVENVGLGPAPLSTGYVYVTASMSSCPRVAQRPSKYATLRMIEPVTGECPRPKAWPSSCAATSDNEQRFQYGQPAKPLLKVTRPRVIFRNEIP